MCKLLWITSTFQFKRETFKELLFKKEIIVTPIVTSFEKSKLWDSSNQKITGPLSYHTLPLGGLRLDSQEWFVSDQMDDVEASSRWNELTELISSSCLKSKCLGNQCVSHGLLELWLLSKPKRRCLQWNIWRNEDEVEITEDKLEYRS